MKDSVHMKNSVRKSTPCQASVFLHLIQMFCHIFPFPVLPGSSHDLKPSSNILGYFPLAVHDSASPQRWEKHTLKVSFLQMPTRLPWSLYCSECWSANLTMPCTSKQGIHFFQSHFLGLGCLQPRIKQALAEWWSESPSTPSEHVIAGARSKYSRPVMPASKENTPFTVSGVLKWTKINYLLSWLLGWTCLYGLASVWSEEWVTDWQTPCWLVQLLTLCPYCSNSLNKNSKLETSPLLAFLHRDGVLLKETSNHS